MLLSPLKSSFGKAYKAKVDEHHTLLCMEMGSPDGIPAILLHGGPGDGFSVFQERYFDHEAFRIILSSQRGAKQSLPSGEIRNNTPDLLVTDLEIIRTELGIDQWHVLGHSWGGTLALLYGEEHPDRVSSLVIGDPFLMRQKDIDWAMKGAGFFYPEVQKKFEEFLPPEQRGDLLTSYFNRLVNPDPAVHMPAAYHWVGHEVDVVGMEILPGNFPTEGKSKDILALARIEAHYMLNNRLTPDDRILKNADRISDIPTVIFQGRHDMVCPPYGAHDLKQALPHAKLDFLRMGHCRNDMDKVFRIYTDRIRDRGTPLPRR